MSRNILRQAMHSPTDNTNLNQDRMQKSVTYLLPGFVDF